MNHAANSLHEETSANPEGENVPGSPARTYYSRPWQPLFYRLNECIKLQRFYKTTSAHEPGGFGRSSFHFGIECTLPLKLCIG